MTPLNYKDSDRPRWLVPLSLRHEGYVSDEYIAKKFAETLLSRGVGQLLDLSGDLWVLVWNNPRTILCYPISYPYRGVHYGSLDPLKGCVRLLPRSKGCIEGWKRPLRNAIRRLLESLSVK